MSIEKGNGARGEEQGRMPAADRRQQLLEVAVRLFSDKGFQGTTTREIAEAAGVSEAIIFRHFAHKEDLYTAILDTKANDVQIERWLDELRRIADTRDDRRLFTAVVTTIVEFHRTDPTFLRLMFYSALEGHELTHRFNERYGRPLFDFLVNYIKIRQKEGVFRECAPDAVVNILIGMPTYHAITSGLLKCHTIDIPDEDAIELSVRLILEGLRAEGTTLPAGK